MKIIIRPLFISHLLFFVIFSGCVAPLYAESSRDVSGFEKIIQNTLNKHCADCHDSDKQKGEVRLDNWTSLQEADKFSMIDRVMEQVYKGTMPPKRKNLLSDEQRRELFDAINQRHEALKTKSTFANELKDGLKMLGHGNYVNHEQLFSGINKNIPGFTYDRHWLISEFIFSEKINSLLERNAGYNIDREKITARGTRLPAEIGNPFLLPKISGERYFASDKISSSHFLTMLGNAPYVADVMIAHLSRNNPDYLPAVSAMTKQKFEQDSILAQRQAYLQMWIDTLCNEMYGSQNEAMLPTYKQLQLEGEISDQPKSYGKNGWNGRISKINSNDIMAAVNRFARKGKDRLQTIRECERFYFHMGYQEDTVGRLLNILRKELVSIVAFKGKDALDLPKRPNLASAELTEIKSTIKKLRTNGMSYLDVINACMNHWQTEFAQQREKSGLLSDDLIGRVVTELYQKLFIRQPRSEELQEQQALLRTYAGTLGIDEAVAKLTETMLLDSEFITRNEYGVGEPDQYGRRMLSPRDASYAIAYALTDNVPDAILAKAAQEGRLNTRADYKREVERLLKDRSHTTIIDNDLNDIEGVNSFTTMPIRKLRFFREFFGYYTAMDVFKDQTRFGARLPAARERLITEADMLVENILTQDKLVFETLLTTDKFYVAHSGDNDQILKVSEGIKKTYEYFKQQNWKQFRGPEDMLAHKEFLMNNILPGFQSANLKDLSISQVANKPAKEEEKPAEESDGKKGRRSKPKQEKKVPAPGEPQFIAFINALCDLEEQFEGDKKYVAPMGVAQQRITERNRETIKGFTVAECFNIDPKHWDYPPVQPAPVTHRMGMLTHPAWLQAFSKNDRTDPVARGKWVQEKLLAGVVPEVPIGVDAVVPEDKEKTLRERFVEKVAGAQCLKCHQYMNPLGMPFEAFDDFGRFRTEEEIEHPDNAIGVKEISHHKVELEKIHPARQKTGRPGHYISPRILYKTKPVNATGELIGTGDSVLDGDVTDAFDLIGRLAKSQRVRQSIIRHAFRYFMGRNELLSDSKTLIDAEQAYVQSGGSFDAVIVSLLTSDSFIYRKKLQE